MTEENKNFYRNAALYTKKKGIVKRVDIEIDHPAVLEAMQTMANEYKESVYIVREFIANDSEYQEKPPHKIASDWFVLEVKPDEA